MRRLLTINAGSSSIKFAVFDAVPHADGALPALLRGQIDGVGGLDSAPRLTAFAGDGKPVPPPARFAAAKSHPLETLLPWLESQTGGELPAAGHRVAFGGLEFVAPTQVTPEVAARLRALVPFAPLHQPANIEAIEWLSAHHPWMRQVACFDSAFHRTMPESTQRYGLPRELHDAGARRYGFHGLSYEYIAGRLRQVDPGAAAGRTIVAHLGSGASLCALRAGASIATTMGFSALSGVMMASRPGELDPGIVIWLLRERGLSLEAAESLLYHESGLKGVSGVSGDMRRLLDSSAQAAREAIELFVYRIAREIGSLAAALGGLDALVFTAGIGEHAAAIREAICEQCRWLGLAPAREANLRPEFGPHGAAVISEPESRVRTWIIPTDEEQIIARHTLRLAQGTEAAARGRS